MSRLRTSLALLLMVVAVSGCFLRQVPTEERILGRWKTELAGFPVVFEYTQSTLGIDSYPPVAYALEGDVIRFDFQGTQSRRVTFTTDGTMVQTDLATGIEQTFTRETQ